MVLSDGLEGAHPDVDLSLGHDVPAVVELGPDLAAGAPTDATGTSLNEAPRSLSPDEPEEVPEQVIPQVKGEGPVLGPGLRTRTPRRT